MMKKITSTVFGMLLTISLVACDNPAKTSNSVPNTEKSDAQTNQNDATNVMRRKQLNSDIRSREQRNDITGDPMIRANNDLKSEVRSKLEANLPASSLAIDAKNGVVTVTGSVVNKAQLQKIEPLAKEIKGVKSVTVKATISMTKPEPPKPGSTALPK
jgi:osmotically-inducible protein OsmY